MAIAAHVPSPAETRFAFLPVGQMKVDPRYQRHISEPRVKRMAAAWDDAKADSITVSSRPSGFFVLDGQHRLVAARQAGIRGLWALVHDDLSEEDEARLWVALNTQRTRPKALEIFKARLAHGDDAAKAIVAAAEDVGWVIQMNDYSVRLPKRTLAVGTLEAMYANGGSDLVRQTLDSVAAAWPDDLEHGRADLLGAVSTFIITYRTHPRFDLRRLVSKLREKPAVAVRQRMKLLFSVASAHRAGDQKAGGRRAILEIYNSGLRSGHLPDLSFADAVRLGRNEYEWPELT